MNVARFAFALLVSLAVAHAQAQGTMRVRGTITAVEGNTLAVKSRDGRDLRLQMPDDVSVAVAKAIRFEDIKPGDYVGATTRPGSDGVAVAAEVHYLASTTAPGSSPWDLLPGSTMTNANVGDIVVATGRRELTLQHKNGTERVLVPEGIPLVRAVPGTRADLVPGEYIFTAAQIAADGTLRASRIQVSKDGVRPPQ